MGEARPADAVTGFVDRLPLAVRPYARLARWDRPIGWWLLLLPCWWSLALAALASGRMPDPLVLFMFFVGAIAMRGAGSTWNDITDRDLDAQVARTRERPLPSGAVSVAGAFCFLALQLAAGLAVLLTFSPFAIGVGLASLLPVIVYPFMKRVISHPQIVLGLAFAWGALMGFAETGQLPAAAWLLYAGAIAWVVGYDTVYALQDIEDDAIVGIGSTARHYGPSVRGFVAACFASAVILIALALVLTDAGIFAFAGLAAFALHLAWQTIRLDRDDPTGALRLFRANRDAGLLLFAGLMLEAVARRVF